MNGAEKPDLEARMAQARAELEDNAQKRQPGKPEPPAPDKPPLERKDYIPLLLDTATAGVFAGAAATVNILGPDRPPQYEWLVLGFIILTAPVWLKGAANASLSHRKMISAKDASRLASAATAAGLTILAVTGLTNDAAPGWLAPATYGLAMTTALTIGIRGAIAAELIGRDPNDTGPL